jgi:AraC-like DNA-binding protein
MSVSQLNRKLKGLINQSSGKLIRSTKLDYASQLLKNKAGNISEIAYRVGFADLSSFTNSFKEKFGVSPRDYLKR